jgi:hypothetical protein
MKKEHFIHFFPFLNKKYRAIELTEITSEKTFQELFPNEAIDYSKLNAVYHYQNLEAIEVLDLANEILLAHNQEPKNLTCYVTKEDLKSTSFESQMTPEIEKYLSDDKPKIKRNAKI